MKVRASKSLWLQRLFLPNLTLFLDSTRFNQSEWERLEHFPPPFGFMELNHSRECLPPPGLGLPPPRATSPGPRGSDCPRPPPFQWCRRS